MSALAQPATATASRRERPPSGWQQLKKLIPYVVRYRGMVSDRKSTRLNSSHH